MTLHSVPKEPETKEPETYKVSYYNWHPTGVECKDIAQEFSYNIGSAFVYLWRAGRKPGVPAKIDIKKAIQHLQYELERIELLEKEENVKGA